MLLNSLVEVIKKIARDVTILPSKLDISTNALGDETYNKLIVANRLGKVGIIPYVDESRLIVSVDRDGLPNNKLNKPGSVLYLEEGITELPAEYLSNYEPKLNLPYNIVDIKFPTTLRILRSDSLSGLPSSITVLSFNSDHLDIHTNPFSRYITNLVFKPNSTITIYNNSFNNAKLNNIDDILTRLTNTNLPSNSFSNMTNLNRVHIPDNITSISNSVFYNNTFTEVPTGLNNITTLSGFNNCTITSDWDLTTLPKLEIIGNNAFSNSQVNITNIPRTITRIEDNAFYNSDQSLELSLDEFTNLVYLGSSSFPFYKGTDLDLTIYLNLIVANNAFRNVTNLVVNVDNILYVGNSTLSKLTIKNESEEYKNIVNTGNYRLGDTLVLEGRYSTLNISRNNVTDLDLSKAEVTSLDYLNTCNIVSKPTKLTILEETNVQVPYDNLDNIPEVIESPELLTINIFSNVQVPLADLLTTLDTLTNKGINVDITNLHISSTLDRDVTISNELPLLKLISSISLSSIEGSGTLSIQSLVNETFNPSVSLNINVVINNDTSESRNILINYYRVKSLTLVGSYNSVNINNTERYGSSRIDKFVSKDAVIDSLTYNTYHGDYLSISEVTDLTFNAFIEYNRPTLEIHSDKDYTRNIRANNIMYDEYSSNRLLVRVKSSMLDTYRLAFSSSNSISVSEL